MEKVEWSVYTFAMRWQFHGLTIEGLTNDSRLEAAWRAAFASLLASEAMADVCCRLDLVEAVPAPPEGEADFRQGDLLSYTVEGEQATAHLPRFGQLRFDLSAGVTQAVIVEEALTTYGVLEDLIAIGLSPHLKRRGLFLIHAFAASWQGRAALLVGGIGAGKTTTGLALLNAGWKLLSNDSPVVRADDVVEILSYPGLLAAYPDSFARFAAARHLAAGSGRETTEVVTTNFGERRKVTAAAEAIWSGVWVERALAGVILFPKIEAREGHALERLSQPEALRRLLPNALEQWDRAVLQRHLTALRGLVEAAPAYVLRLGPQVETIPEVVLSVL